LPLGRLRCEAGIAALELVRALGDELLEMLAVVA